MKIEYSQWVEAAEERYGKDSNDWKFRCPV